MGFIKCGACMTVLDSTVPTCPACGRCPGCGRVRVTEKQLRQRSKCDNCDVPYCTGCGRCHACGQLRTFELPVCECGFPADSERVAQVEKSFGI